MNNVPAFTGTPYDTRLGQPLLLIQSFVDLRCRFADVSHFWGADVSHSWGAEIKTFLAKKLRVVDEVRTKYPFDARDVRLRLDKEYEKKVNAIIGGRTSMNLFEGYAQRVLQRISSGIAEPLNSKLARKFRRAEMMRPPLGGGGLEWACLVLLRISF